MNWNAIFQRKPSPLSPIEITVKSVVDGVQVLHMHVGDRLFIHPGAAATHEILIERTHPTKLVMSFPLKKVSA